MPAGNKSTPEQLEAAWQENDCERWNGWLAGYDRAVAALGSEKLTNLDRWYRGGLPVQIAGRRPPCIYHDELQGIASWKMHRGVWREGNRQLVASNSPEKVEEVSREAFAAVPDPRKPVAILSTLAGVGAATASAALAAYAPQVYPFFDEVVAAFIPGLGPVAFSIPYYLKYAEAIRGRAERLKATCPGRAWSAQDVSQALWALATAGMFEAQSNLPGGQLQSEDL